MLERSVRKGTRADRRAVARILARAFQDDPVMSFIFPDPGVRRARLADFLGVIYESDRANGCCFVTANGEAAATWRAPDHGHLSFFDMIVQAWPWVSSCRTALARALIYSAASDANHPKERHWYLHIAGCHPAVQGRGFGGAAIRAGLAHCDADALPAYLETASEKNLAIYSALGFDVTHEWTIRKGPRCWSMIRAPRPPQTLAQD